MFAVIDTEGSGIFDYKKPADADGQPRMAELAIIYLNDKLEIEREYQAYVKPDGWAMAAEATAINGLTTEFLIENGKPVAEILAVYSEAITEGRAIVAFNAQHDCKTLRAELRRAGMPDLFEQTRNVCVMRKANGHILKKGGKKGWPSMQEAREFLQASGSEWLDPASEGKPHGALRDARDATGIFRFLTEAGVNLTPEVHFAREDHPAKPSNNS